MLFIDMDCLLAETVDEGVGIKVCIPGGDGFVWRLHDVAERCDEATTDGWQDDCCMLELSYCCLQHFQRDYLSTQHCMGLPDAYLGFF